MWNWIRQQVSRVWNVFNFVRRKLRKAAKYLQYFATKILPIALELQLPWMQRLSQVIGYAQLVLGKIDEVDAETAKAWLLTALMQLRDFMDKVGDNLSVEILDEFLVIEQKILALLAAIEEKL